LSLGNRKYLHAVATDSIRKVSIDILINHIHGTPIYQPYYQQELVVKPNYNFWKLTITPAKSYGASPVAEPPLA